jgi:2-oxoglutarate ferredoxin oxidoreductase subunit alpha
MDSSTTHLLRGRTGEHSLLIQGNRACALGALDAGVRFFAGYPITPSSEIMETMAEELPRSGGTFLQMEDEIASICTCVGAALAGEVPMTATSGPGFSLMQEGIGFGIMVEAPLVVVNVMRVGPSTGRPTTVAQGDVMQARWGTHGDHPAIVLAASDVADMYRLTKTAVYFSQRFHTPVILLSDQMVGQTRESFTPGSPWPYRLVSGGLDRSVVDRSNEAADDGRRKNVIGRDKRLHVTGLTHDESNFPTGDARVSDWALRRLCEKVAGHWDELCLYDSRNEGNGRVCIVAYGSCARAARAACRLAEQEGLGVEVLHLYTLFPLPEEIVRRVAERVDYMLVPELNLGQYADEVRKMVEGRASVVAMGKTDGTLFTPRELVDKIRDLVERPEGRG